MSNILNFAPSLWAHKSSYLHNAVISGDKAVVNFLLNESIIDINTLDRWGRSALFHAVISNNVEIVELFLKADAKLDILDIHQRSLVYYSVKNDQSITVKLLLQALQKKRDSKIADSGLMNPLLTDINGCTLLHLAAKHQSPKCLQLLIKNNLFKDFDCKDSFMRTPLHWAASYGSAEALQLLLKCEADANLSDEEGNLPIHLSLLSPYEGSKNCLQTLLHALPFTALSKNSKGLTAIHLAVITSSLEKVKLLNSVNKELLHLVDDQKRIPLHYACARGDFQIVQYLISCGSDINRRDIYGGTPLHYAAKNNHTSVVELILKQEGVRELSTDEGETPVHWATRSGSVKALLSLISHGGSVTKVNFKGRTPLHIAAMKTEGSGAIIEVLLQVKAPLDMKAYDGCTPLLYAAQRGNMKIVYAILKADPLIVLQEDSMGRNVLHHSVIGGKLHLTHMMLETAVGVPVDSRDLFGMTSLHLASYLGFYDVLALLLENSADPNALDNEGKKALHLCALMGHQSCVEMLLQKGIYVNSLDAKIPRSTPLDYALRRKGNNEEVVKLLRMAGAHTGSRIRSMAATTIQREWRRFSIRKALQKASLKMKRCSYTPADAVFHSPLRLGSHNVVHSNTWSPCTSSSEDPSVSQSIASLNNCREVREGDVRGTVFYPLLSPFFPHERDNLDQSQTNGFGQGGANMNRRRSSSCETLEARYVYSDRNDVTLMIPEGDALETAQRAWQKRLSGITLQICEDKD